MAKGLHGFENEAGLQADYCEGAGIVTYASLLRTVNRALSEKKSEVLRSTLEDAWKDREFSSPFERPLLLLAALRFAALGDASHPLASRIDDDATGKESIDLDDVAKIESAITREKSRISLRDAFVQTNEVSRSITWQLALSCFPKDAPIILVDLGSAAGATLVGDRIAIEWLDLARDPITFPRADRVRKRIGLDRRPVDLSDDDQATWLRACIWPGQHDRARRFRDAVTQVNAARKSGELELREMDALQMPNFLEAQLEANPDACVLAVHTAFIDYLPPETRAPFEIAIDRLLAAHPDRAMLVGLQGATGHVVDPKTDRPFTAEIRLRRGSQTHVLAALEWHPHLVAVDHAALASARAR